MSVALITFLSMQYASPNFFRKMFDTEDTKFFSTIYWFSADGFLMFILPMILIPIALKSKPSEFGFVIGDYKFGLKSALLFVIVMLPFLWVASGNKSFAVTYPQGGPFVRENISVLFYYELFVGFYMFAWEFFWRGYMLFRIKTKIRFLCNFYPDDTVLYIAQG